jgi:hypothetical protein
MIQKQDESYLAFVYLKTVKDKRHPYFNPYDLEIVDFTDIDKNDYYTLSREVRPDFESVN